MFNYITQQQRKKNVVYSSECAQNVAPFCAHTRTPKFCTNHQTLGQAARLGLNWLKLYLSIASERSDEVNLQQKKRNLSKLPHLPISEHEKSSSAVTSQKAKVVRIVTSSVRYWPQRCEKFDLQCDDFDRNEIVLIF